MFGFLWDVCIIGADGAEMALGLSRYRMRLTLLEKNTILPEGRGGQVARQAADMGVEVCLGAGLRTVRRMPLGFELETDGGEIRYARFILNAGPQADLPDLAGTGPFGPDVPGFLDISALCAAAPTDAATRVAKHLESVGLPLVPRGGFVPDWYGRCV